MFKVSPELTTFCDMLFWLILGFTNHWSPNFCLPFFFQGTSSTVDYDPCLASAVSKTNILVIEGYLFELPYAIKTILQACEDARRHGALIAVTASDVSCIERFHDHFWYGAHLVFACVWLFVF